MASTGLSLARAVMALIGAGALLMAVGGLTSGESLTDPVFPGGLALGALSLAAAAWVDAGGAPRALLVWAGLVAAIVAIAVFASFALRTPSADVLLLFAVPSIVVLAAVGRIAVGRIRAGALG